MAHGGAQAVFDRHHPYWEKMKAPIRYFSPEDDPIQSPLPPTLLGKKQHHGPVANRRFKDMLLSLEEDGFEGYLIMEYDAIFTGCLKCLRLDPKRLWCNLFYNSDKDFKGTQFCHPPLLCSHQVLSDINDALEKLRDDCEKGFWDRMLGLALDESGILASNFGYLGFSRNTVEDHDIGHLAAAARRGAQMFHGIKTPIALEAIKRA